MRILPFLVTLALTVQVFAAKPGARGRIGEETTRGFTDVAKSREASSALDFAARQSIGEGPSIDFASLGLTEGAWGKVSKDVEGLGKELLARNDFMNPPDSLSDGQRTQLENRRVEINEIFVELPGAVKAYRPLMEYAAKENPEAESKLTKEQQTKLAESRQIAREAADLAMNLFNITKSAVADKVDVTQATFNPSKEKPVDAKQIAALAKLLGNLPARELTQEDIYALEVELSKITARWRDAAKCE